jgi:hypothetical protein
VNRSATELGRSKWKPVCGQAIVLNAASGPRSGFYLAQCHILLSSRVNDWTAL